MSQHLVPRTLYYGVFATLLALTLVTVGVAFLDLGPLNTIIALTIAAGKALLVMLFFMHLRYSSSLTWIFVAAGVCWLLLLIGFTLGDYLTRSWLAVTGWGG
jgi:cytochrome c oxidase subunit 4